MLLDQDVNYLAVLVAAVAGWLLGAAWYSRALFGRRWMQEHRLGEQDVAGGPGAGLVISLLAALVALWVTAIVIGHVGADGVVGGLKVGAFLWLGFVASTMAVARAFSRDRSIVLWLIESGYWLGVLLVGGAIIGAWP